MNFAFFRSLWRNKVRILLAFSLSFVSFCLCLILLMDRYAFEVQNSDICNMFSSNIADVGIVRNYYVKDEEGFGEELNNIKERVRNELGLHCGGYTECDITFDELEHNKDYIELNRKYFAGSFWEEFPEESMVIFVDPDILNIIDCNITSQMLEPVIENGSVLYPVYVGSAYQDVIRIGDVLTEYYYKTKYIVRGYIDNDVWFSYFSMLSEPVSSMECKFLLPFSEAMMTNSLEQFSVLGQLLIDCQGNCDYFSIVKNWGDEKDIKFNISTVESEIDLLRETTESYLSTIGRFGAITALSSAISLTALFCALILTHKREYAIRLAMGRTNTGLAFSMFIKNICVAVISFITAIIATYLFLIKGEINSDYCGIYFSALSKYAIPLTIPFVIVFSVVSTILPFILINRMNLVELIKEDE